MCNKDFSIIISIIFATELENKVLIKNICNMKTKFIPNGKLIPTCWGIYIQDGKTKYYFEKKDISFLTNLAEKYINNKISVDDTENEISAFFNVSASEILYDVIIDKFYNIVTSI